jgi:polysaccharide biosynthesis protein PslE
MKDLVFAVFRHKGKGGIFFGIVLAGTVLFTILAPRKYHSEGKLYLRLGRENATLDPTATLGENSIVAIPQSRENEINSVAEMVQSRAVLEKVVDKLGTAAILEEHASAASSGADSANVTAKNASDGAQTVRKSGSDANASPGGFVNGVKSFLGIPVMSDRDKALTLITKNLRVEPARKSNVIEISYIADSPKMAQRVVSSLIDCYIDEHVRLNRPHGSHEFFAVQTNRLYEDLVKKEQALRDLKNRTGLASTIDRRKQIVERIGRLEDDLFAADAARAVSEAKVAALQNILANLPDTQMTQEISGFGNEGTDRMRDQLYALHVKESEAGAKYTDEHPKLQEIKNQINKAKKILDGEERTRTQVTKEPGRLYQQAQQELLAEEPVLASLSARTKELRSQLVLARDDLRNFNENELQVAELGREVEMLDGEYRKYSASLEQARIDQALEIERMSNINIAQAATFEETPVSPRLRMNLLLGLAMGLFGAIGLCLGCDRFNNTLHTPDELEKHLSLPILATIPRLKPEKLSCNGRK